MDKKEIVQMTNFGCESCKMLTQWNKQLCASHTDKCIWHTFVLKKKIIVLMIN